MHSTLNDKELIIQCLEDEFKNKTVKVETVFYTDNIKTYLHSYSKDIFYYGCLSIGQKMPKIQFHLSADEHIIPESNSQHVILFRRLTFN